MASNSNYDSIIIGGDANGLVAAAYLAKRGKRVLVVEPRETLGGPPSTRTGWIPRPVMDDLKLASHGLRFTPADPAVAAPQVDGDPLILYRDVARTAEAIRRFSAHDAENWPAFSAWVAQVAELLREVYLTTPPNGLDLSARELPTLGGIGLKLRRMGDREMMEALRVLPMSALEFLEEWFETDILQGTLAAGGIRALRQGPYASGTALMLIHHQVGAAAGVFRDAGRVAGGEAALIDALVGAAQAAGAELRTGCAVEQVIVRDRRAVGVALAGSGEEIGAKSVVSSADPYRTFTALVDPVMLPPDFMQAVRNIKLRGSVAILDFTLDALPRFNGLDESQLAGVVSISPSIKYLERAYDAAKYRQISERPFMEITFPSMAEADSEAIHMRVWAQYAPYTLDGGWDAAARETLLGNVLGTLEDYAPGIGELVRDQRMLTPVDLEAEYGLTEGALYQGEIMLDQMYFMRPVAGYAQYRTPIAGLYLCGDGAHPGGGTVGAPAYNAAREILRDL